MPNTASITSVRDLPVSASAVTAARVSLISTLVFLVLFVAVHFLKPEIDPSWRFISEYAIGRWGWIMNLTFLSMAVSYVSLVLALRTKVKLGGKIGLGFLMISATGLTLAALFTMQPLGTSPDALTASSKLHGWGAMLGTNGAALGSIVVTASLFRRPTWRSSRWYMAGAVLFILLATAWFMMNMPPDGKFGPDVPIGWPNRVLMMSYWVWLLIASRHAFRLSHQPGIR